MPKQPPNVNGVMDLTTEQTASIKAALEVIQSAFVETDEQPVCDTFYLTATYNQQNPDAPINGDTCQFVLGSGDHAISG